MVWKWVNGTIWYEPEFENLGIIKTKEDYVVES